MPKTQPNLRAVPVSSPDAEPEILVQVMVGNLVVRMRGRAAAIAALAAFNQDEVNRPFDFTDVIFHSNTKGVSLQPQPTVDHYSYEKPSATVERFKQKRR